MASDAKPYSIDEIGPLPISAGIRDRIHATAKALAAAEARAEEAEAPKHGDYMEIPRTCQRQRKHRIVWVRDEWWLCWQHPDGRWVTESPMPVLAAEAEAQEKQDGGA